MGLLIRHPREIPKVSDMNLGLSEIKLPQFALLYIVKKYTKEYKNIVIQRKVVFLIWRVEH